MKRTLVSIEAEIQKLKATADKLLKAEVAGVVGRIRTAIDHYALTAEDLGFGSNGAALKVRAPSARKASQPAAGVGVAKYRDAATGKTWTGRGKPPSWISGAEDRNAFLIGGKTFGETPTGAKHAPTPTSAKAAKASKGGTPKYRDPASGKTWTGVGKPPAWIAGASDRSGYLISANKPYAIPARTEAAPVAADAAVAGARTSSKVSAKPTAKRMSKKPAVKRKVPASKATTAREPASEQSAA